MSGGENKICLHFLYINYNCFKTKLIFIYITLDENINRCSNFRDNLIKWF